MNKLLLVSLFLITLCSCSGSEEINKENLNHGSALALEVENYLKAETSLGFSGSIIVLQGDEVILQKGYGLANRETRTAYSTHTIQTCGSVTKQFTAAAILLLESEGKLSVRDELSKYFEGAPEEYQRLTLHQLLTHSAGIISGIGPDEEAITKEDFLSRLWPNPLEFEPGTSYGYSNAGYSLLGMIIEQVTGSNYEDYLREHLFLPSKMASTGYLAVGVDTTLIANGYSKGKYWGKVFKNGWLEDGPGWHLRANGGMHTTIEDMHQWLRVMQGKGVLEPSIIEKWTEPHIDEGYGDSEYAYGLVVEQDQQYGKVISHSGSNRIFGADLFWLPEQDMLFYIHSNSSLYPAYRFRENILAAAFDSTFQAPPRIEFDDEVTPETVQSFAGNYATDIGSVDLSTDDVRLMARLDGQGMLDRFLSHSPEQQAFFSELNDRTAEALVLLKNGKEDALKGLMPEGEDPVPATERLLRQRKQFGDFEYLKLVGTFENTKDSRFSEIGAYTTFVHARFPNWNRYWNFVFDQDGKYLGTYSGPWPTFTMIPTEGGKFTAVRQEFPHETVEIVFEDDCLVLRESKVCPAG